MQLGSLFEAVVGVVTLPVAAVKDVITLGGISTDNGQPYLKDKIEEIAEKLNEFTE